MNQYTFFHYNTDCISSQFLLTRYYIYLYHFLFVFYVRNSLCFFILLSRIIPTKYQLQSIRCLPFSLLNSVDVAVGGF